MCHAKDVAIIAETRWIIMAIVQIMCAKMFDMKTSINNNSKLVIRKY